LVFSNGVKIAANGHRLAKCGYSVIRLPRTVVDFYLKFNPDFAVERLS
jgi:hypothetical protein